MEAYDRRPWRGVAAATVLLDAHDPARRGGTGTTIDWTAAARVTAPRGRWCSPAV
jgi:phosphoribosylanthranilate isomerase